MLNRSIGREGEIREGCRHDLINGNRGVKCEGADCLVDLIEFRWYLFVVSGFSGVVVLLSCLSIGWSGQSLIVRLLLFKICQLF